MAEKERKFKVGDNLYAISFISSEYDTRAKQHPIFSFVKMEIILVKDNFIYLEPVATDFDALKVFNSEVIKVSKSSIFDNFADIIDHDKNAIVSGDCWKHLEFCVVEPYETLNTNPDIYKILGDLLEEYFFNVKKKRLEELDSKILSYLDIIHDIYSAKKEVEEKYKELDVFVKNTRGDIMVKTGRFNPIFYRYF